MNNIYSRVYSSLYRGVVEDNNDPQNLGRCKIRVPSVHGELTYPSDLLPWARPLVLSPVRSKRGSVNIPDTGSIVWVLFEGSDRDFPVYLGGTYATGEIDINKDIIDFYIEDDNKISYDRKNEVYSISIGDNKVVVSKESIRVVGDTTIEGELSVEGDTIINGSLSVKGDLYIEGTIHLNGSLDNSIVSKEYIDTLVGDISKVLSTISEKQEDIINLQRELSSNDSPGEE